MASNHSPHPYYPVDAEVPGYSENESPLLEILGVAGTSVVMLLAVTLVAISKMRPTLSKADRLAILWFVLSGSLHCIFECYFVVNRASMGSAQDFLGQLWKEYALSDSRYMTSDTLVLCMEVITVLLWGPLCLSVAYTIFSQHSLRHPLQIIVCMGHLYGDVLYYATSLVDYYAHGVSYSRLEPYYFWVYYFAMNFIWIVVPAGQLTEGSRRKTE
ncbi:EBP domain protein [Aspergillus sp. HF37]|nr:EBP domain protein [Aspergillus sp. HF37]